MRCTSLAVAFALAATFALHTPAFLSAIRTAPPAEAVEIIPVDGEAAKYWPRWRGPSGQGIVTGATYADRWSETENVAWKVSVPGRGNSSPIVWGDRIFLTTSYDDGRRLSLLCFDRKDGTRRWEVSVPQQGVESATPRMAMRRRRRSPMASACMHPSAPTVCWRRTSPAR